MPLASLSDKELLLVGQQIIDAATPTPATYATTAAKITALTTLRTTFQTDVTDNANAQAAALAATKKKNGSRAPYEEAIREFRDVAKGSKVTEDLLAAVGLIGPGDKGPQATVPAAVVNTNTRLRHELSWTDAATPTTKKRPSNAIGVEIWRKIDGDAPKDVSECTFVAMDTASPYMVEYSGDDGNKIAHYMLRWQLKDGTKGGFGDTASATITA